MDNAMALRPAPLPRYAPSVFGVFLVTQVLDGLFTYWGVTTFGVGVEANVLLATSIEAIGAPRVHSFPTRRSSDLDRKSVV